MTFSCCLIGADTLLLECGDILLSEGHDVRAVVTASERVRRWAAERKLRCVKLDQQYPEALRADDFDYLFAITHLRLVPDEVLLLPRRAAINFHDGPLPRYAGLNAPAWALMDQVREYGITWHLMVPGTDEGDIVEQRVFELLPDETSLTLNTRNFEVAIDSFRELVAKLEQGTWTRRSQDLTQRTYFSRHQRPARAALLDWSKPATELDALVRALDFGNYDNPLAVPKLWLGDRAIRVSQSEVLPADGQQRPGTLSTDNGTLQLATADGVLAIHAAGALDGPLLTQNLRESLSLSNGSLPTVPQSVLEAIAREELGLARAEGYWEKQLSATDPAQVVLAQAARLETGAETSPRSPHQPELARPPQNWRQHSIALPACNPEVAAAPVWAIAAMAIYLARTSGHATPTVTFRGPTQDNLALTLGELTSAFVPLVLPVDMGAAAITLVKAVAAELQVVQTKRSFFRDLVVRRPALATRPELAQAAFSPVLVTWEVEGPTKQRTAPTGTIVELRVTQTSIEVLTLESAFGGQSDLLVRQLRTAIENIAVEATKSCAELSLLDEQQRQLLDAWNATTQPVSDECIHTLFERQAALTPDRTALAFRDRQLTYAELDARANAVAHELRRRGVEPDQLVGVMVERSFELLIATLGVLKAGAAYVPLDPAYPPDRIHYMLNDSAARLLLTQSTLLGTSPEEVDAIAVEHVVDAGLASGPDDSLGAATVTPSNLAYVIYTSGSTGKPKGVMVEHRNVANFFVGMDAVIPRSGEGKDVWLAVTSLSFDISVLELFWTLSRGVTVVIHRDEDRVPLAESTGSSPVVSLSNDRPIDFSIFLWGADDQASSNKYDLMLHAGRFGDEHGFSGIWTPERHFHAFGGPYPNPAVTGAALAAVTSRVQIRAGSCVVPLHHPVRVAEEWAVMTTCRRDELPSRLLRVGNPTISCCVPRRLKRTKK